MKGDNLTISMTLEANHWLRLRDVRFSRVDMPHGVLHIELNVEIFGGTHSLILTGLVLPTSTSKDDIPEDAQCVRLCAGRIPSTKMREIIGEERSDVWLQLHPAIPWNLKPIEIHSIHFERLMNFYNGPQYVIGAVRHPTQSWHPEELTLRTTDRPRSRTSNFAVFNLLAAEKGIPRRSAPHIHDDTLLAIGFDTRTQTF